MTNDATAMPLLTPSGDPLPYADAIAELESILSSLESSGVDVDSLATQVERATALIGYCRTRLATVENNVAAVLDGDTRHAEVPDE
ncbi:MAG: exodeoxyribonuclease VII small subunit [Acidimicrobiales bacterium]